jgi:uncharacterized protein (TIGR02284 family)
MEISEKAIDVINDLIKINNDRVAGFEKAGTDLEEGNKYLVAIFNKLAGESQQYVVELTGIAQEYGEAADGTSTSGDLHRAWIDIKSTFTGGGVQTILDECERGEDAAKAAYRDALDPENELDTELVTILQRQQQGITEGHDRIKSLRDELTTTGTHNDQSGRGTTNSEPPEANTLQPIADPFYEGALGNYREETAPVPEPENIEQEEAWQDEQNTGGRKSKLMEFFINELKDLLWAERELVETLPDMAEAATSAELKAAFEQHRFETEGHIVRLEEIFAVLGLEPESRKCEAMAGILDEGDEIISATEDGTAQRDVGLIFAGQKAEHYEIASYGGMIALAKSLGYYDIAEILVLTVDEEKSADALLTQIAENQANEDAANERAED